MSMMEHVEALKEKHARLEQEIAAEEGRPAPDPQTIHALKRAKLRIRDEIEGHTPVH